MVALYCFLKDEYSETEEILLQTLFTMLTVISFSDFQKCRISV